jgi:hypothetical protein
MVGETKGRLKQMSFYPSTLPFIESVDEEISGQTRFALFTEYFPSFVNVTLPTNDRIWYIQVLHIHLKLTISPQFAHQCPNLSRSISCDHLLSIRLRGPLLHLSSPSAASRCPRYQDMGHRTLSVDDGSYPAAQPTDLLDFCSSRQPPLPHFLML